MAGKNRIEGWLVVNKALNYCCKRKMLEKTLSFFSHIFGHKESKRLKQLGVPEAFGDEEVNEVLVALEEAGFGPR